MGMKTYKDYVLSSPNAYKGDSTYDKQKNRVQYQKYVNNYLAEQQRDEQLAQIKKSKESALSESAIASERARKYVDAVNKHYGIAGTGYAESKAIDLFSQEAKRRAEINNAHSEQENEALKAYQQAVANATLVENEALGNIELAEDEANEAKRQAYVAKLQELNDNPDTTNEDFSKYYKEYAQYLGEDDKILQEDLEAKYDSINKLTEAKKAASEKGVELGNAITLEELEKNRLALGKFADDGDQSALLNSIIKLANTKAKDGKSVLDGKAFDVNFGYGKEHYYFKDGVFYDISKKEAKKIGIIEIDAQGNIVDKKQQKQTNDKEKAQKMLLEQINSANFELAFNKKTDYEKQDYISTLKKTLTKEQFELLPEYIKKHLE